MTSHDEQRLSDALRRQADSTDPHLFTLDDVTTRARGIRRRRTAATGLVAAAALAAIVVPTAIVTSDRADRSDSNNIATQTPNATADPSTVTSPTEVPVTPTGRLVTVQIGGELPAGAAPSIPISIEGSVLTTDGERIKFGDELTYFAQVGDAYAGIVRTSDTGEAEFQVRSTDGSVVTSAPANIDGALAVTEDGTAVAYVGTDQRIHTWTQSDGDLTFSEELPNIMLRGVTNADEGTCKEPVPEGPGCTVVFSRGTGGAGYATSGGIVDEIPGFNTINDLSNGVYAGQVSNSNEGSCNEVRDARSGQALWETCDATPVNLSPSADLVTALPAYFDAVCCSTVSVFDVAAGKKILEIEVPSGAEEMGYIPTLGWEDETHLIAGAFTDGGWRVVRVGLDGKAELLDVGELPTTDIGEVPIRTPVRR